MIYQFNDFTLDTVKFTLTKADVPVPVEPQVFNIILFLIQQKHKVVSRQELLDTLWQDRIVSDSSISNQIKSARKVLGDDGVNQSVIKTIHGRGYQFIASVESTDDAEPYQEKNSRQQKTLIKVIVSTVALLVMVLSFFAVTYYKKHSLYQAVEKISNHQEMAYATFIAQAKRRNELVAMIESRVSEERKMEFEKFFSYHFDQLNGQEKFVFEQIRAMTDIGLYQNNLKILNLLETHPQIYDQIQGTKALQQHLTFWLNKYNSVFRKRQDMCLLYVGVEDGVPYPSEVNDNIKSWLNAGVYSK